MKNALCRFRISDGFGDGLYMEVRIYKTKKEMHKAFLRIRGLHPHHKEPGYLNFSGIVTPYQLYQVRPGRKDKLHPVCGSVLLCKEYLTTRVVAHEMVHVATTLYRRRHGRVTLGAHIDKAEEEFAYSYGNLIRRCTNALFDRKLWR